MKIAICDDKKQDALMLSELLPDHQVNIFHSPFDLINTVTEKGNIYDVYLLDIYMETDINGIDLAKRLREIDDFAQICFISSSGDFYREAYDIQDINYLLKPVTKEDFEKLISRIETRRENTREKSLNYRHGGNIRSVPYNNILFISSSGHNVSITCKDGTVHSAVAKLDDIELQLDSNQFFRCHQSFIINLYKVDTVSGSDVCLAGKIVPVSRKYTEPLKRRYREILFEEVN